MGRAGRGDQASAVHATHLTAADVTALGATRTTACFCPTTERDLADGIGPEKVLLAATAADVDTVVVGGDVIVTSGRHRLGDTGRLLALSIDELWSAG